MSCPYANDRKVRPVEGLINNGESDTNASASMRVDPNKNSGMLYGEYLKLDQLLDCQQPITRTQRTSYRQQEVHDEHLFIVTHQTYELWFKQIIFEVDSVRDFLNNQQVNEKNMWTISTRLHRTKKIFGLLSEQFSILKTMTPLDFMDFRDYLAPASGFQSYQFRIIENKLGICNETRSNYKSDLDQDKQPYVQVFGNDKCIEAIKTSQEEPSLFKLIESWLERTPGLEEDGFNFMGKYEKAVDDMLKDEESSVKKELEKLEQKIATAPEDEDIERRSKLENAINDIEKKKLIYDSIIKKADYDREVQKGKFRLSHRAMHGALMIFLYRDEPRFNQPHELLNTLTNIDEVLLQWRQNHNQMVLRMIGQDTLGTGGSSGYQYLRTTTTPKYNIFLDLCNLSTYLIPRERVPKLTPDMRKRLSPTD